MTDRPFALVTGAAQGIGAAIADALLDAGYDVMTVDIEDIGHPLHLTVDLAASDAPNTIRDRVAGIGRQLDLVVHCAALSQKVALAEVTEELFSQMVAVNMRSPLLLTRDLVPLLASGASVVTISSIRASRGFAGDVVYQMTKGALESMTRALAIELADAGIRVNAVAPGAIATPMNQAVQEDPEVYADAVGKIPTRRFGTADEVADAVLFLAHNPFVTGHVLCVDGGQTARG